MQLQRQLLLLFLTCLIFTTQARTQIVSHEPDSLGPLSLKNIDTLLPIQPID